MADSIQRPIRNNNREIIGYEEVETVPANNDREDGILYNTVEVGVPTITLFATEEEEAKADEEAKKLLEESKESSPSETQEEDLI